MQVGGATGLLQQRLDAAYAGEFDGLKVLGLGSAQNLGLLLNLLGLKAPEGSLQGLDGVLIGFWTPRSAPAALTGPLSTVARDHSDRGSSLDRQRLRGAVRARSSRAQSPCL